MDKETAYQAVEIAYAIRTQCQSHHAAILHELSRARAGCEPEAQRQIDHASRAIQHVYDSVDTMIERLIVILRTEEHSL